jgi:peptide chain release factor subunit 1
MSLSEQLDRLAAFEPAPYPVVSLYLNTQPDQHGRDNFQTFTKKELKARLQTYGDKTPDRDSLDHDVERINNYLESELQPSANSVVIFACHAGELFEAVQLDAPIEDHWLSIADRPHLYPLARLVSQFQPYAAVLADTNSTRILVVAQNAVSGAQSINGVKTRRTSQGGWSQARFQRHIENYHLQHIKDVIEALDRTVTRERIEQIVVAGEPVVLSLIREQMPKHLAEKIVDELKTDLAGSPDGEVIRAALETMRKVNERTDREKVDAAVGAYRAGGLGVVGPDQTLLALTNGQVDELLLTASLASLGTLHDTPAAVMAMANDAGLAEPAVETVVAGEAARADIGTVQLADELVARARQTAARVTFIEDASLLEANGGVAALLRFRI